VRSTHMELHAVRRQGSAAHADMQLTKAATQQRGRLKSRLRNHTESVPDWYVSSEDASPSGDGSGKCVGDR